MNGGLFVDRFFIFYNFLSVLYEIMNLNERSMMQVMMMMMRIRRPTFKYTCTLYSGYTRHKTRLSSVKYL